MTGNTRCGSVYEPDKQPEGSVFCIQEYRRSSNMAVQMKLTVYTSPWCGDCRVAKRWLDQNKIAYEEINIEETPGAADEVLRRTGKRAIPAIRDRWHMGAALYPRRGLQVCGDGRALRHLPVCNHFGITDYWLRTRADASVQAQPRQDVRPIVADGMWARQETVVFHMKKHVVGAPFLSILAAFARKALADRNRGGQSRRQRMT